MNQKKKKDTWTKSRHKIVTALEKCVIKPYTLWKDH